MVGIAGSSPLAAAVAERIPDPPGGSEPYRRTIAEAVAIIVARFRPRRIVLYGSRVYGTPTAASDADLMVVIDSPLPSSELRSRIWQVLNSELVRPPVRLDVHVRRPEQVRAGLAEKDFYILAAMEGGVTLYDDGAADPADDDGTVGRRVGSPSGKGLKRSTVDWLSKAKLDDLSAQRLVLPPHPLWDICSTRGRAPKSTSRHSCKNTRWRFLAAMISRC